MIRFSPNRPSEIESIVDAIRAAIAGGITRVAQVANSLIRFVNRRKASHQREQDSRLWSQNSVLPPKPRNLIIE